MKTYSPLTKPSLLAVNTAERNVRGLTHHKDTYFNKEKWDKIV